MILSARNIMIAALLVQSTLLLYLSHYGLGWVAVILVVAPLLLMYVRGKRTKERLLEGAPDLVLGLCAISLISLTGASGNQAVFSPVSQIICAAAYFGFVVLRRYRQLGSRQPLLVAGIMQTAGTAAVFLILTFWHWPGAIVLGLLWGLSAAIAYWYFTLYDERASVILSMTWALIVVQVSWVFTIWLVNYTLAGGGIALPQAALVVLGLGYCLAGIYQSHNHKRLSQRRLVEYMVITGVLLAIIVAGTRWSGTS